MKNVVSFRIVARSPQSNPAERELVQLFRRLAPYGRDVLIDAARRLARDNDSEQIGGAR